MKTKPKTKPCMICQKEINLDSDNYVRITDYFHGEHHSEGFYHSICYQERLKGGNAMQKVALSLATRAHKMLDKVDGKEEEKDVVYQIA